MADNFAHPCNRSRSLVALVPSLNDHWLTQCDVGRVLAIDDLSDDDLLSIFFLCRQI